MGRVFYNWNEALQTKNILHGHAEESGTMAGITITVLKEMDIILK